RVVSACGDAMSYENSGLLYRKTSASGHCGLVSLASLELGLAWVVFVRTVPGLPTWAALFRCFAAMGSGRAVPGLTVNSWNFPQYNERRISVIREHSRRASPEKCSSVEWCRHGT